MKEGTADSQLPRNINHRDTTVQFREPQEDTKERAKEHRINFSADPDFPKLHPDPDLSVGGCRSGRFFLTALARRIYYRYPF